MSIIRILGNDKLATSHMTNETDLSNTCWAKRRPGQNKKLPQGNLLYRYDYAYCVIPTNLNNFRLITS